MRSILITIALTLIFLGYQIVITFILIYLGTVQISTIVTTCGVAGLVLFSLPQIFERYVSFLDTSKTAIFPTDSRITKARQDAQGRTGTFYSK